MVQPVDMAAPGKPRCRRYVKYYPAARRHRFARTGQLYPAAADGPVGPGSHQPGAPPDRSRSTRGQVEQGTDHIDAGLGFLSPLKLAGATVLRNTAVAMSTQIGDDIDAAIRHLPHP